MKRADPTAAIVAAVFVSVALGFSLLYWFLNSLSQRGLLPFLMGDSVPHTILRAILGDFGPALAAVLVSSFYYGRAGLKQLWLTLARWRVSYWLYLLAFLGPMVMAGLVAWTGVLTGSMSRNPERISSVHFVIVFFVMAVVDGPLGEEVGWRGLLLPQLLRRLEPLSASLIVGGVWWLWHVPLYLADGRISKPGDWIEFLIDTLALSLIVTWFYLKSGSSTFLAIVLHNSSNFATFLVLRNIWHKVGVSMIPNYAHDGILLMVAAVAVTSLLRHSPQRTAG